MTDKPTEALNEAKELLMQDIVDTEAVLRRISRALASRPESGSGVSVPNISDIAEAFHREVDDSEFSGKDWLRIGDGIKAIHTLLSTAHRGKVSHKLTGGPVYECKSFEWGWGIRNRNGLVCKVYKPSKFEGQDERFKRETEEFRSVVEFIIATLNGSASAQPRGEVGAEAFTRDGFLAYLDGEMMGTPRALYSFSVEYAAELAARYASTLHIAPSGGVRATCSLTDLIKEIRG